MTKREFIEKYQDAAVTACAGSPIFPELALAEAAVESAWGESYLTKEANNFFGTKSTASWEASGGAYVLKPTREVVKGKNVIVHARFRKYACAEDSFKNYVHFVTQPGYVKAGVTRATTAEEQMRCIADAGYATDPTYAALVIGVMAALRQAQGVLRQAQDDSSLASSL